MKRLILLGTLSAIFIAALATSAVATDTNQASYWEGISEHPSSCYKHEGDSRTAHGTVGPSNTLTLNTFNQSWPGDHWETLVIKYATFNDVYQHPAPGVYVTGTEQDISHWIVCKGTTPDTTTTTTVPETTTTTVPETTTTTVPEVTTTTQPEVTTTTVPEVTTTTVPEVTTTTVPEETTTTVPEETTTTTVADSCDENSTTWNEDTQNCELPFTGPLDVLPWGLAGLVALGVGSLAILSTRASRLNA